MERKTERLAVGVLFGGKSGEHDVSLVSGTTVMERLDKTRYDVYAIGIRRDGALASPGETEEMLQKPLPDVAKPCVCLRQAKAGHFLDMVGRTEDGAEVEFDLFFPVLHGTFGEDGTLQGLLEMTEKPFVGCGVLGSAAGMDKETLKFLFSAAGLSVPPWLSFFRPEFDRDGAECFHRVETTVGYPCFVKPSRLGSSVGISKAHSRGELATAMEAAFSYDYKILVEKGVDAREIECSVMGNDHVLASQPGEILPSREFYDYDAKYLDDRSQLVMPAELPSETAEAIRDMARRAFRVAGAEGYARVDFLLDRVTGTPYVSEINTIPGFTAISMFPKLWELDGKTISDLLDELIRLGLERHAWKAGLKTSR